LKQEQQHIAVRPGNAQFISVCQVASNAATLRPAAAVVVVVAAAAVVRQFTD